MAKVVKVSATRIGTFLRCKKKYSFQYKENLPKLSNPSFKLGIACHESLELAGNIWRKNGQISKEDHKEVLDLYDKISVREGIEDMEVHSIGRDLVEARIANFDLGSKIVSLEEKFGFPKSQHPELTTFQGVPLIGAMDKVIEFDEDTLIVVDYKTSKTAPTPDQLRTDLQLSLYDVVANILYPQYKRVILCLDMLKSEPVYTYRTPEQRKEFEDYLVVVHKAMEEFEEKDALPSLNVFCPWCDYRDYCETYTEACTKSEYEFMPIVNYTNEELIAEWEQISTTSKILETRKRELSMVIMEKIKSSGADLKGTDKQIYIRQSSRTNYDPQAIQSIVPADAFCGMVSIKKTDVDKYCDKHPKIKQEVMKNAVTNFSSPFLATKNLSK